MSHLLIYDADLSGHHRDYLDAVVDFVQSNTPLCAGVSRVSFMLPLDYWLARPDSATSGQIHRLDIPAQTLEQRNALSPRKRAVLEIELLAGIVAAEQVDELILMNLDYFQVALATPRARLIGCPVSGIQLQPYTRTELVALRPPRQPALLFRALRKRLRLQKMLNNTNIARLLIPADAMAVEMINKRHAGLVDAIALPEPYLSVSQTPAEDVAQSGLADISIHQRYGLDSDTRIILVFGKLAARKNIENVIQAMSMLKHSGTDNLALLVVGKAGRKYQEKLRRLAFKNQTTRSCVFFDFDFVEDTVLRALFKTCHIVAMPYSKAYQSSGILFQAIQYSKPVIAANQGLVDELVREYGLGKTVNPASVQQISEAIANLLDNWGPSDNVQALKNYHTPENHAAVLLHQR